jgi:hypothetical protein
VSRTSWNAETISTQSLSRVLKYRNKQEMAKQYVEPNNKDMGKPKVVMYTYNDSHSRDGGREVYKLRSIQTKLVSSYLKNNIKT